RHHPLHGRPSEVLYPILHYCHAVPHLRYRSSVPLPLGCRVQPHRPLWFRGNDHFRRHPGRGVFVRMEERCPRMGVIQNLLEEGYVSTTIDGFLNYCRSCSIWPMTFGL